MDGARRAVLVWCLVIVLILVLLGEFLNGEPKPRCDHSVGGAYFAKIQLPNEAYAEAPKTHVSGCRDSISKYVEDFMEA